MDLHNLFHFLRLRLDAHAQYEIRVYAQVILDIIRVVCPMAVEAFEQYKLGAETFSKSELEALKAVLRGEENPLSGRALALFEEKLSDEP